MTLRLAFASLALGLTLALPAEAAPDSLLQLRFYPSLSASMPKGGAAQLQQSSSALPQARWSYDSIRQVAEDGPTTQAPAVALESAWRPNSTKALLWALLPGGGQIYNRKYWKLPIVWGAFTACYYAITWNNRQYQEYHAAYRDLMSADPQTNTAWLIFAPVGAKAEDYAQYTNLRSTLKRGNDYYRRYRDLSIVVSALVYGLSLLDAYVDAELYTFDISPDLSLRLSPEVAMPALPRPSLQLGVNCSLTF